MLGSAIQFYQKFNFGGNIDFFRLLGFFEKNLKPKKCILGGGDLEHNCVVHEVSGGKGGGYVPKRKQVFQLVYLNCVIF